MFFPFFTFFVFCISVITFETIKKQTHSAPQNDRLNFNFVKVNHVVGKMARSGGKIDIQASRKFWESLSTSGSRYHYFTKDAETGYTTIKAEGSLGKIDIYEYTHLKEPDTKASIVKISATSKKLKKLSKLNDYVVGQFYSGKKQALTDINQVVQKMKSGVYDENMIVGKFTDILANERLEEPTEGKHFQKNL